MLNDNLKYKKLMSDQEYLDNGLCWLQGEIDLQKETYKEKYSIKKAETFAIEKLKSFNILEEDIKDIINKIKF